MSNVDAVLARFKASQRKALNVQADARQEREDRLAKAAEQQGAFALLALLRPSPGAVQGRNAWVLVGAAAHRPLLRCRGGSRGLQAVRCGAGARRLRRPEPAAWRNNVAANNPAHPCLFCPPRPAQPRRRASRARARRPAAPPPASPPPVLPRAAAAPRRRRRPTGSSGRAAARRRSRWASSSRTASTSCAPRGRPSAPPRSRPPPASERARGRAGGGAARRPGCCCCRGLHAGGVHGSCAPAVRPAFSPARTPSASPACRAQRPARRRAAGPGAAGQQQGVGAGRRAVRLHPRWVGGGGERLWH